MAYLRMLIVVLFLLSAHTTESSESSEWAFQSISGQQVGISYSEDQITWISGHKRVSTNDCKTEELVICFQVQGFIFALPKDEGVQRAEGFYAGNYLLKVGYKLDEIRMLGVSVSDVRVYHVFPLVDSSGDPIATYYYSDKQGLIAFYQLNSDMKNAFIYSGELPGPFAQESELTPNRLRQ